MKINQPITEQISKGQLIFIENINKKSEINHQQINGDTVINWFKNIDNKHKCIFIQFHNEDSYPSFSKGLLMKAIFY